MLSFIGTKFNDGKLTVVGKEVEGKNPKYLVKCSVCAQDSELHGDGIFKSHKYRLHGGYLPCGCGPSHQYSEDQWVIIIKRECERRNFDYISYEGKMGNKARLVLRCRKHGNIWNTTTRDNFLYMQKGCSICRHETVRHKKTIPVDAAISRFYATGAFDNVAEFVKITSSKGEPAKWKYKCTRCSNDSYTSAGLCTGWFESLAGQLFKGKRSCRCHPSNQLTEEQAVFRLKQELNKGGDNFKFVKVVGDYTTYSDSRATVHCDIHGEWDASFSSLVKQGSRCPGCAKPGFSQNKPAYLYVLSIQGRTSDFTGFGITNQPEKRLRSHKNRLGQYGYCVVDSYLLHLNGVLALNVESSIKRNFKIFPQEVPGFIDEATQSDQYYNVISYARKCVDVGNVVEFEQFLRAA